MKHFLGKMFGTHESIERQIEYVNALKISDEQKEFQIKKIFADSASFKIIQRIIAFIFTLIYVIAIFLAFVANYLGMDYKAIVAIIAAFDLGMIILAILGFYFSGGAISSLKKE